jgi:hypothetical protein
MMRCQQHQHNPLYILPSDCKVTEILLLLLLLLLILLLLLLLL